MPTVKSKRTHAVNAHTPDSDPAEVLIADASGMGAAHSPTPEAVAALRKLIAYNDTRPQCGASGRVSRKDAVKMLRESFGWGYGEEALEGFCRRILGRKSWGKP